MTTAPIGDTNTRKTISRHSQLASMLVWLHWRHAPNLVDSRLHYAKIFHNPLRMGGAMLGYSFFKLLILPSILASTIVLTGTAYAGAGGGGGGGGESEGAAAHSAVNTASQREAREEAIAAELVSPAVSLEKIETALQLVDRGISIDSRAYPGDPGYTISLEKADTTGLPDLATAEPEKVSALRNLFIWTSKFIDRPSPDDINETVRGNLGIRG